MSNFLMNNNIMMNQFNNNINNPNFNNNINCMNNLNYMNNLNTTIALNNTNNMNNMNYMNNLNNMNYMNNMNSTINMNNINNMNNMNNFCPNAMNNNMHQNLTRRMSLPNIQNTCFFPNCQQNFFNPRASMNINQMNQMNPLNQINPMNQMNQVNNLMCSFNNLSLSNNFINNTNMSNMSTMNSVNNLANSCNLSNSGNLTNSGNINVLMSSLTLEDPNKDININFRFINSQIFSIKAKSFEKLKDVVKRFKNKECPEELQNSLSICICHGEKVDQEKTLKELNIKEGEQILFMDKSNKTEENEEKENEYELTDKEKEFLNIMKNKYMAEIIVKKKIPIKKNKNNQNDKKEAEDSGNEGDGEDEDIPTFLQFLRIKDRGQAIAVNEHNHKLVYCMTRLDWTCNICNKNYKKEDLKYYCSLCNYNMCQECHEKGKYFMKKSFSPNISLANPKIDRDIFQTDYHEHKLVYCRTSRSFIYLNGWICDNCRENFHNNKWSFYCTICDFDLCGECCGFN